MDDMEARKVYSKPHQSISGLGKWTIWRRVRLTPNLIEALQAWENGRYGGARLTPNLIEASPAWDDGRYGGEAYSKPHRSISCSKYGAA